MSTEENQAVPTTNIGGRPPGSGRSTGSTPRGIEVLVKKAAVDSEFRELLFEKRGAAATGIGLELDPAENAMLSAIPQEQLAQIVSETTVPVEQRRVFLGRLAVAMLAVLGGGVTGCETPYRTQSAGIRSVPPAGIRPDQPNNAPPQLPPPAPPQAGVQPDLPHTSSPPANQPSPPLAGIQPDRS